MVSDKDVAIAKIVAGIVSVLVTLFILFKLVRARLRKKANDTLGKSPKQNAPRKKVSSAELRKWYREAIDKIVNARLQKECSTTSGEPVILSHYINQGRLRHWVLHTHSHKYELRQRVTDDSNTQPCYTAVIAPSSFDLCAYQRSVTLHHSPEVGNYFYSMIGWTALSKEQVDQECHQVSTSFGTYALFSNNCHDFLQRLADKIVTTKAPDWEWFRHQAVGGYQYIEQPALGYHVISAATWSKHLAQKKTYLSAAEQKEIDDFILILEDLIETTLKQSIVTLAANTSSQNATGSADGGGHHDYGGGHAVGGHHHDGGGGGGGGSVV
ncbi:hypothetical protein BJX96DRAFT_157399 [Aspergillus floccosus]